MSYGNFLIKGVSSLESNQFRSNYPRDTVISEETSNRYSGRYKLVNETDPNKKAALIDSAVKVTTVADNIRKEHSKTWSFLKRATLGTFTGTLIGGIAAVITASVIGTVLPPLWPVAVAVGVVALGILGFSFWNLARGLQADKELDNWEDPVKFYCNERRKIGEEGIVYAVRKNYKGKLISKKEMVELYLRTTDQWVNQFNNQGRGFEHITVKQIRKFIKNCPFERNVIDDTFDRDQEDIKQLVSFLYELSNRFNAIKRTYEGILELTNNLRNRVEQEKRTLNKRNNSEYNTQTTPTRLDFDRRENHYYKVIADANRQIRLSSTPSTIKFLNDQKQKAQNEINELEAKYEDAVKPFKLLHESTKQKIEDWAKSEIQKINDHEDNMVYGLNGGIKQLLEDYQNRNVSKEIKTSTGFVPHIVTPPSWTPEEEKFMMSQLPPYPGK